MQYQSNELRQLLEAQLRQNISGVLALETKVNSWSNQRRGMLVIHHGELIYGDEKLPTNQQFAKILGDKLQPNSIDAALKLASLELTKTHSVRELIQILVKLGICQWEDIETYAHKKVVATLEKFDTHPGELKWDESSNFDLCFGEECHGLNWIKLLRDLGRRRQKWASFAPTIPSMDAVPYVSKKRLSKISNPKARKHFKTYLNGRLSIVEIATTTGKDPLKIADYYLNWVNSGIIRFLGDTEIENQAKTAVDKISNAKLPKVLSVDDSLIVQISIKRALSCHYQVFFANKALDALNILNQNSIDLLLLDLTMPELDGLDFCKIVRKIPRFQHLPIIILTARDGFIDKIKGQIAGSNEYIAKPFRAEELLEVVNKHIKAKLINPRRINTH